VTTEQAKAAARDLVADRILVLADTCGLDKLESWRLVSEAWDAFDASWKLGPTPGGVAHALRDATNQLRSLINLLDQRRRTAEDGDPDSPADVKGSAGDGTGARDGDASGGGQGPALADMPAREVSSSA
jgi:hypothetical protein